MGEIGVPLTAYHSLNIPMGLIRITSDTRNRINHWLLAYLNEAGSRSIEVKNQKYDTNDQDSHDV